MAAGSAQITSSSKKGRSLEFREAVAGYLFILPWIIGFLVFTAGPMIASFYFSFTKYEILTAPRWIGLGNYANLIEDDLFWKSLWNTGFYVILGVPLRLLTALIFALLLNQKIRGIGVYRTLFYLPTVIPLVATALLWLWVFNPDFGLANTVMDWFGLPHQKWLFDVHLAKPTFILLAMWHFGTQMVIFLAGLQGIPESLYDAAKIDGAGRWRRFTNVTLPMLSPVILFNLVITMIQSFQVFSTALIATQGGPQNATLFYVLYLYRNAFSFFKMGYASTLAWVLFLIILALTGLQFVVSKKWVHYETE